METGYIKEFIVLAETKNYLQASEEMFISQSSLSKHIKTLESEIGFSLFDRTTRKVKLTEYGNIFLKYAKEMTDIQYCLMRDLKGVKEGEKQILKIGSIPQMAPYHITDILVKFQNENKNCSIRLFEEESAKLKEMLRKNSCDLAFIREENDSDPEFAKFPFTTDHLVAVMASNHPLANEHAVSLTQLKDENFLLLQPDSLLYNLCTASCKEAGFSPNIAYTGKRAENIIDLVEKGMGVALLMVKPILHLTTPKISIVDIDPVISTNIYIYYKKNFPLSAAAKKFILNVI